MLMAWKWDGGYCGFHTLGTACSCYNSTLRKERLLNVDMKIRHFMRLWEFNYEIVQGDILKASIFRQHVARVALDVNKMILIINKTYQRKNILTKCVCFLLSGAANEPPEQRWNILNANRMPMQPFNRSDALLDKQLWSDMAYRAELTHSASWQACAFYCIR